MEQAEQGTLNNATLNLNNNNNDIARVSTPVKKARQEGLIFVHPDLETRYLSEEDIQELRRHKQRQARAMKVIEKTGKRKNFKLRSEEVKLSQEQWAVLAEFWEHPFFIRARGLGLAAALLALVVTVVAITSPTWVTHSTSPVYF